MIHDPRLVADIRNLVDTLRPELADHEPEAVGAALAELVAIFIAGHAPSIRSEARRCLLEHIDNLVPMVLEQLIEQGIVPEHWKTGFDA